MTNWILLQRQDSGIPMLKKLYLLVSFLKGYWHLNSNKSLIILIGEKSVKIEIFRTIMIHFIYNDIISGIIIVLLRFQLFCFLLSLVTFHSSLSLTKSLLSVLSNPFPRNTRTMCFHTCVLVLTMTCLLMTSLENGLTFTSYSLGLSKAKPSTMDKWKKMASFISLIFLCL